MLGKFEIIHGNGVGTCLLVREGETWTMGRSTESDFYIDDDHMSRIHCEISSKNNEFFIRNKGSRNGCHLNGKRQDDFKIAHGDLVRIGHTVFEFSVASDEGEGSLKKPSVAETPVDPPSKNQLSEEILAELKRKTIEEVQKMHNQSLEEARTRQQNMLPTNPNISGFEFDTLYMPADVVSGDFYDFINLKGNHLGIVIGDVSGHGVEAAIVMGMARKVINLHAKFHTSPHETIVAANEDIWPDLDEKTFCSVFYATLNIETKLFHFIKAGHNPLLLLNPRRQPPFQEFNPKGMVIGMMEGTRFSQTLEEVSLQLMSGDMLVQYTDGICEAMNEKNEEWGTNNFHSIVKKYGNTTPKNLLQKLDQSVKAFCGNAKQSDDITLLIIKVL